MTTATAEKVEITGSAEVPVRLTPLRARFIQAGDFIQVNAYGPNITPIAAVRSVKHDATRNEVAVAVGGAEYVWRPNTVLWLVTPIEKDVLGAVLS